MCNAYGNPTVPARNSWGARYASVLDTDFVCPCVKPRPSITSCIASGTDAKHVFALNVLRIATSRRESEGRGNDNPHAWPHVAASCKKHVAGQPAGAAHAYQRPLATPAQPSEVFFVGSRPGVALRLAGSSRVHSTVVGVADSRSASPWFKSGRALRLHGTFRVLQITARKTRADWE
jgi:hypothetical protein